MKTDNPAGRLHNILTKSLAVKDHMGYVDAWSEVFGLKQLSRAMIFQKIGSIMQLPQEIENELRELKDINVHDFMDWRVPFEKAFLDNAITSSIWGTFKSSIREEWLKNLAMVSYTLSHRCPEPTLDNTQLDEILKSANELILEIKKADIPADVKKFMVASLNDICAAVNQYMVYGIKALSDAIDKVIGGGALNTKIINTAKQSDVGNKFLRVIAKTHTALSAVSGMKEIASVVSEIFPSLGFKPTAQEIIVKSDDSHDDE